MTPPPAVSPVVVAEPRTRQSAVAPRPASRGHLPALTSLRFVAAAMIVLGHTRGGFGFPEDWGEPFVLWHGVPFFFVLSGFILAYVYPTLDAGGIRRFFAARIARIWPVHAVALLVVCLLVRAGIWAWPFGNPLSQFLANLAMVHAWVPYPDSYYAFNAASWSVSTELGLYLLFPLLIQDWRRTWPLKLVLACYLLLAIDWLGEALKLPPSAAGQPGIDVSGLRAVHPLANLYLFAFGMTGYLAWDYLAPRLRIGALAGTVLELIALALATWTIYTTVTVHSLIVTAIPWVPASALPWIPVMNAICLTFPTVIVVMALQRGLVSRALSHPVPVLLGEISYALYLIHQPIRAVIAVWVAPRLPMLPPGTMLALYWLACLAVSMVLWWVVERPARGAIRAWWRAHEPTLSTRRWLLVGAGLAAALLLLLTVHVLLQR